MHDGLSQIEDLVGEELSAVSFVRFYVELHFEEKVVRALTCPTVVVGRDRCQFPAQGSRDQLCARINSVVTQLVVSGGCAITIWFSDGAQIVIGMRPDDRHDHGEAAHYFRGPGLPMDVFLVSPPPAEPGVDRSPS